MVAIIGRELTVTECRFSDLEHWLVGACWCIHRLAHYTTNVLGVEVAVPNLALFGAL